MYRPPHNINHRPPFQAFHKQQGFSPRGRGPHYVPQQFNNRWKSPSSGSNHYEEHWCETCDRGFATPELLDNHKQQHQKCNIDGCQFIAHPKVITKHIQMQHSTGLFQKIGNLSNPEEIKKWREERKKKYPTKQNVDKKNAARKEKIERGEKMGLKVNKTDRGPELKATPDSAQKRKFPFENKRNHDFKKKLKPNQLKKPVLPRKENHLPSADDQRKLKPFLGFQYLMLEEISTNETDNVSCNYIIEDDDDNIVVQELIKDALNTKASQPSVCGALSSLICQYGSTDDECDDETIPHPKVANVTTSDLPKNNCDDKRTLVSAKSQTITENVIQNIADDKNDNDSGPEESKVEKSVENQLNIEQTTTTTSSKDIVKKVEKLKYNHIKPRKPKSKLPSTLLGKLLHREIKQERNIVLQCVRHIVKHDFFDTK